MAKADTTKKNKVYSPRLKQAYLDTYKAELLKELKLKSIMQVPLLEKIVVNIGLGKSKDDKKMIETANNTLRKITAQQPVQTKAKKSIATFKLREGNVIGLKVTLRGDRMYEFLDRIITIVLPRIRDFHGVSYKSFDKDGNYSIGLVDQSVFPELSFEETSPAHGLQIVFVVKSIEKSHSAMLLEKFGMPFRKEG